MSNELRGLRAEVEYLREWQRAAAATLLDVEALADLRDVKYPDRFAFGAAENYVAGCRAVQSALRAVLARSRA